MICGGSTVSDSVSPSTLSSQTPASAQCSRLVLTTAGIAAGWKVESMPQARVMPELVLLPDGRVFIVNGAQTGVAGYGNVSESLGRLYQADSSLCRSLTGSAKATRTIRHSRLLCMTLLLRQEVGSLVVVFRLRILLVYTIRLRV